MVARVTSDGGGIWYLPLRHRARRRSWAQHSTAMYTKMLQAGGSRPANGNGLSGSAIDDGCPDCGSKNVHVSSIGQTMCYECKNCGKKWM